MKTTLSLITLCSIMAATLVAHGQDSSYSTKPWLHQKQIASSQVHAKATASSTVAKAQPAYTASSKPWLQPVQPVTSSGMNPAEPKTLLADHYNSKKAARGERESARPVFQIAPLK